MFSIIVCSIRPAEAEALRLNIKNTIGSDIPFEVIAYDNRGTGKGICQVYNECAAKAAYDILCFMHEDVEFKTIGWGKAVADKLSEPDCGVIGFAGNVMKSSAPTGWSSTRGKGDRYTYIQRDGGKEILSIRNPYKDDFSQVITLDGMCLFMNRKVWENVRFDEDTLKGFHCYDIDVTVGAAAAGYRNWVCHTVLVEHFSMGSYGKDWAEDTLDIHRKWQELLPMSVSPMSDRQKKKLEDRASQAWLNVFRELDVYDVMTLGMVLKYVLKHPLNGRSYKLLKGYLGR